ncbi:NfeD family protein [Luteimonas yindakuii]|uniref:NfeD family protein n=1 Tax=Luteimonas yindakuii TaxID=2565782 RepID=UPI0010A5A0B3|nr:NfeD family protein [Luteimonas yindakuii]QCO67120.1 NfeD family protein [Luteimonas yindakuii]
MRWEVVAWAAVALLLFAAETLAPGAFMLWMGFAAAAMFVGVLLVPGIGLLWQVAAFVVLSFVSIQVYRTWFRGSGRTSDHPTLNRRAAHHLGRVVPVETAIVDGRGRVKIGDAFWVVAGPDLPVGAPVRVTGADGMVLLVESAGHGHAGQGGGTPPLG